MSPYLYFYSDIFLNCIRVNHGKKCRRLEASLPLHPNCMATSAWSHNALMIHFQFQEFESFEICNDDIC